MKIPYGIADFHRIRTEDQLYVDRTDRIALLENLGAALLFLRPRRFGKSLWISTLANYYDLRTRDEHDRLFGDLAIGREPTPLAHRYFVLQWDLSEIDPDPPRFSGDSEDLSRARRISREIHGYVNSTLRSFLSDYREHLPEMPELGDDAFHNLDRVLDLVRRTPSAGLYLLIDEYDNFANEVLTGDRDAYEGLVHADGPFKHLFKWVKASLGRKGIDRLWIAGVSPMVMSDLTSGMNVADSVYLLPELNTLCGFTEEEVRELLDRVYGEATDEPPSWTPSDAADMLRQWYNGYRFTAVSNGEPASAVYNPTLVLYFLKHLRRYGAYPRQMLDANLAADEGKLEYVAQVAGEQDSVLDLIRKDEPLEIPELLDRFTLRQMLERSARDHSFLGAYLYYHGMLTLAGETPRRTWLLATPNEVVRALESRRSSGPWTRQRRNCAAIRDRWSSATAKP